MKKLTIFTPTYNRAYILNQLYESLVNQTNKDFCWLIVDDGSSDNTKDLVQGWIKEKKVDIEYIQEENGGKMRAHNAGVMNCKTDLFLCVDSDDYLVSSAVEQILVKSTELDNRNDLCGIIAYKGKSSEEVIGNKFPQNITESSLNNLYRKGFEGDTTLIFKTKVLKQFLFPEIEGEKFITEDFVYCQIDEEYKMVLMNSIITICSYLEDGYTKNAIKLILNNPKGMLDYYNLKIKLAKNLKEKIKFIMLYTAFGKLTKTKECLKRCNSRILYFFAYPFSMIYYFKKKKISKELKK